MLGRKYLILTTGMESGASLRTFPRVGRHNGIAESESLNRELLSKHAHLMLHQANLPKGRRGQKPNLPERGKKSILV